MGICVTVSGVTVLLSTYVFVVLLDFYNLGTELHGLLKACQRGDVVTQDEALTGLHV